jgi:hypothetical protein
MIWGLKLKFVFSSIIERLHSFPRYQLNKSHGSHVGVPDKRLKELFASANNNFIAFQSHFYLFIYCKPQAKLVLPVLVALIILRERVVTFCKFTVKMLSGTACGIARDLT